ncbi:MAG: alanine/ornithine racemase family PLP-dependent enzyme [Eubacteriaceae bacterium]|nr:alanine/ornithine racemase family PLP-dependent enzyme [Eubacteriaceae bacterium]
MRATVHIDLEKIKHNANVVSRECEKAGISLAAVTKVHCAATDINLALYVAGIRRFADSRIENLAKMREMPIERWLLRVPAPSIASQVIADSDLSLNSEIETVRLLNKAAKEAGKTHGVILMWDLGDLREGYFSYSDIEMAALEALSMPNIHFRGIGTNLNCYGGVDPSVENMDSLIEIAGRLEAAGAPCEFISGGASSTYSLLLDGTLPGKINNLRIGDSIYLGRDRLKLEKAPGMHDDAFVLSAEVVEIKSKPSIPIGNIGLAALNVKPAFTDKGIRKRAILSVGKQDIDLDLVCLDSGVSILGGSSDHLIADISDSGTSYKVGSTIQFKMGYSAILRAMTSAYVEKEYA